MSANLEQLTQSLAGIVGRDHVNTDLFERINYADTSLPYDVQEGDLPDVVVHPGNTEEVAEVLKYANQQKIPVTTYGSGTSLIFGTKPNTEASRSAPKDWISSRSKKTISGLRVEQELQLRGSTRSWRNWVIVSRSM